MTEEENIKILEWIEYQQNQKTYTPLLGSQNTLVILNAEKLGSLGTNLFRYGPADK